jgi:monomeric isocitrate dehydrogenase
MDKMENKISKRIEKVLKKELGIKYKVILKSNKSMSRDYKVLVYDSKSETYYLNRVFDSSVATVYENADDKDVPATIRKVLYGFFIA